MGALPSSDFLLAFPVKSGLVSVPCGHDELLTGRGLASFWICTIYGRSRGPDQRQGGMPRIETIDVRITPLDLSIAKGARGLGVSSRLSTVSISRFGSYRVSSARSAADFRLRLAFDGYCPSSLWSPCGMMNTLAQTKPTLGRNCVPNSTTFVLRPPPDRASLSPEGEVCRTGRFNIPRNIKTSKIMMIARRTSTRACEWCVWGVG